VLPRALEPSHEQPVSARDPSSPFASRGLLVISPHLDDAALSCGELIAAHPGARVLSVFAGVPRARGLLTEWDQASGFRSSAQAMRARRAEDRAALAALEARPRWLEFLDAQYGATPGVAQLARALAPQLRRRGAAAILFPLGLFHSDHRLAADAALSLFQRDPQPHWYAYEDALYRRVPGALQARLAALARLRIELTPAPFAFRAAAAKRRALRCYASQLRALATPGRPGHADALAPERYWQVRVQARRHGRRS
jgi:LmbE family N-acetylglucosaminyl deacetylase